MREEWKRWKVSLDIPEKLVLDSLVDDMEGLFLNFSAKDNDALKVRISFVEHALSYRNRDEGEFIKKFNCLRYKYGDEFYTKWSLFEVTYSDYVQWFNEESLGAYQNQKIRHLVFVTMNDIVEILTIYEPKIEIY